MQLPLLTVKILLAGVKQNFETRWIGWAGVNVQDEKGRASLTEALALKVGSLACKKRELVERTPDRGLV